MLIVFKNNFLLLATLSTSVSVHVLLMSGLLSVSFLGCQETSVSFHQRQQGITSVSVSMVALPQPKKSEEAELLKDPKPLMPDLTPPITEVPEETLEMVSRETEQVFVANRPSTTKVQQYEPTPQTFRTVVDPTPRTEKQIVHKDQQSEPIKRRATKIPQIDSPSIPIPASTASQKSQGAEVLPAFYNRPDPVYPAELVTRGIEGKVELLVTISIEGKIKSAVIHKSSGFSEMDHSAMLAVKRWTGTPAKRGGVPIEKSLIVPIIFKLKRR